MNQRELTKSLEGLKIMPASKVASPLIIDDTIDIQSLFELNSAPPKDAVKVASTLSGYQRAKIAQFCYARNHMRQMGLHIASTCEMPELQRVFGAGAETIYKQSRDVEATLEALNKAQSQYGKKPVTLRVVQSDNDDEANAENIKEKL